MTTAAPQLCTHCYDPIVRDHTPLVFPDLCDPCWQKWYWRSMGRHVACPCDSSCALWVEYVTAALAHDLERAEYDAIPKGQRRGKRRAL